MNTTRLTLSLTVALLLVACGSGNNDTSSTKTIRDIVSMQARSDGNFDVVCRNGSHEIATPDQIQSNSVCGGGSSSAACTSQMIPIFNQRKSTTQDQDGLDALNYCRKNSDRTCYDGAFPIISKRKASTGDADITDSGSYCAGMGSAQCLIDAYAVFSKRTGTTVDQDVDDSRNYCVHN